MSQDSPQAPAGWYPNPSGGQRYWDGQKWLDIPEPESSSTASVSQGASEKSKNTKLYLWIAAAVVAAIVIVGGSIAGNLSSQEQARIEEQRAQDQKEAREKQAAENEQQRILEERNVQVAEIVESVKGSAQKLIGEGYINGAIIDAYCNPVAGGSLEDLTETTTVFECFVATEENGDGTQNGYFWDVTKNWDSGRYTWDFRDN